MGKSPLVLGVFAAGVEDEVRGSVLIGLIVDKRANQVLPAEVAQSNVAQQHLLSEKFVSDSRAGKSFAVQVPDPRRRLFQELNLLPDLVLRRLFDAAASGEGNGGIEIRYFSERRHDIPDVVIGSQGPVFSSYEGVAGKEPSIGGFVQANMIHTVAGRVNDLEAEAVVFHRFPDR